MSRTNGEKETSRVAVSAEALWDWLASAILEVTVFVDAADVLLDATWQREGLSTPGTASC